MWIVTRIVCGVLLCVAGLQATTADSLLALRGINVSGSFSLSLMRITKSSAIPNIETDQPFLNGAWIQSANGSILATKSVGPRLKLQTDLGGFISSDIQGVNVSWAKISRQASAQLNVASAVVKVGALDNPWLELTAGYSGYNYTRVRDFGGYLYTSGLYPMYLSSSGGWAGIAGVVLRSQAPRQLRHDLILNVETDRAPYMDVSAGYIPTLNLDDKVEIGLGVKLHRILPAASVKSDTQQVFTNYVYQRRVLAAADGSDSIVNDHIRMPYSGVKLMGRFYFDALKTFGASGSFWG